MARATTTFALLFLVSKAMGQRAVARMTLFDFTTMIFIGSIAAAPLSDPTLDMKGSMIGVGTLGLLDVLLAQASMKNSKVRRIIQEKPIVLIQDGRILEDTMRRTRLNLDELLSSLRQKSISSISDVEFAILEQDGSVSVIPKSQARWVTPRDLKISTPYEGLSTVLVEDGKILKNNLRKNRLGVKWLLGQLQQHGVTRVNDVMAAVLDTQGRLFVSIKGQKNEQLIH